MNTLRRVFSIAVFITAVSAPPCLASEHHLLAPLCEAPLLSGEIASVKTDLLRVTAQAQGLIPNKILRPFEALYGAVIEHSLTHEKLHHGDSKNIYDVRVPEFRDEVLWIQKHLEILYKQTDNAVIGERLKQVSDLAENGISYGRFLELAHSFSWLHSPLGYADPSESGGLTKALSFEHTHTSALFLHAPTATELSIRDYIHVRALPVIFLGLVTKPAYYDGRIRAAEPPVYYKHDQVHGILTGSTDLKHFFGYAAEFIPQQNNQNFSPTYLGSSKAWQDLFKIFNTRIDMTRRFVSDLAALEAIDPLNALYVQAVWFNIIHETPVPYHYESLLAEVARYSSYSDTQRKELITHLGLPHDIGEALGIPKEVASSSKVSNEQMTKAAVWIKEFLAKAWVESGAFNEARP